MNYRSERVDVAKRIVAEKLGKLEDVYLAVITGSVGDPYGHVTNKSDLDMTVWATNPTYLNNSPSIDWSPYTFVKATRRTGNVNTIDVDSCKADISFRLLTPEQMREDLARLVQAKNVDRKALDSFMYEFVESQPCIDKLDLCKYGREATTKAFSDYRGQLASGVLNGFDAYKGNAEEAVRAMTYVLCCARNLPRCYDSVMIRNLDALWEHLGINRNRVDSCATSTEQAASLVREMYEEARQKLPELNGLRVLEMRR